MEGRLFEVFGQIEKCAYMVHWKIREIDFLVIFI